MKIESITPIPVWMELSGEHQKLLGFRMYQVWKLIRANHGLSTLIIKFGKCGILYKANQIIRMAEAANLPVCIDWAQGSRPLDTATGQMHVALRLVACDPGMDYY